MSTAESSQPNLSAPELRRAIGYERRLQRAVLWPLNYVTGLVGWGGDAMLGGELFNTKDHVSPSVYICGGAVALACTVAWFFNLRNFRRSEDRSDDYQRQLKQLTSPVILAEEGQPAAPAVAVAGEPPTAPSVGAEASVESTSTTAEPTPDPTSTLGPAAAPPSGSPEPPPTPATNS